MRRENTFWKRVTRQWTEDRERYAEIRLSDQMRLAIYPHIKNRQYILYTERYLNRDEARKIVSDLRKELS